MAIVGMSGRKILLNIPSAGTSSDVVDLGLMTPDIAQGSLVMTKGAAAGADLILLSGQTLVTILSIVSVVQGVTTYVPTTDYLLTNNTVDWSPAGDEPAEGTQYTVTFTYRKETGAKSYRRWDVQIIALATVHTGTVNPQISDTETLPGNFRNIQSGGADIVIAANKATAVIPLIGRFFRLLSTGAEAAQRDFVVLFSTITNER